MLQERKQASKLKESEEFGRWAESKINAEAVAGPTGGGGGQKRMTLGKQ